MARSKLFGIAVFTAGLLAAGTAPSRAAYTGFNIFGDSLSDLGNLYAATGGMVPTPYAYSQGRFSNGPIWVEDLAKSLKLPTPTASIYQGTDYAWGSATASRAIPNASPVPTVTEQVGMFLTQHVARSTDLYAVWIGSNDVLDVLDAKLDNTAAEALLTQSAQAEAMAIQSLSMAGARTILVGLVPDISKTPFYNNAGNSQHQQAYDLSLYYNQQLATDLEADKLPANIYDFDTFKLLDDAAADPKAFDLKNVTDPCYSGKYTGASGSICGDPQDYLFWDHLHPTEAGHSAVAAIAAARLGSAPLTPVPLPASAPLFGASILLVGAIGYGVRRRSGRLNGAA